MFPMIPEADRKLLADDIVTFGQRDPIILLDGMVLDGRNRQWACGFADVEPIYEQYVGGDPLNFVLSKNLHRRHLTESQRALIAAAIVDWERGVNQTTAGPANLQTRRAAEKLSISERAVYSAKRIHEKGAPELLDAIRAGKVTIHTGEAISELQHSEQAKVIREEKKAIVAKAKEIRSDQQKVKHAVRMTTMGMIADRGAATAPAELGRVYPVYYFDAPWQFGVHSEVTGREKSAENHYPTMPTDDIVALMSGLIGGTNPAVCFAWATNPMLPDALRVLDACGFTYVQLIGRRGDVAAPLPGTQPETVHRERKGKHSAKPAFFAEQIERLYPGLPKLELFCRDPRPGWDAWGFEASGRAAE
jgi:N6-adenosine-specific RNA methylase IME4